MLRDLFKKLWSEANSHFSEVEPLAKKDENGNLVGIWGAMSDCSHSYKPWGDNFSRGLYLAGIECIDDAKAPEGWAKWTIPGYEYICAEAEKRGLRLWILDDKKFPTGYANGGFEKHPEKSKLYLGERHMDIMGPCRSGAVLVENFIPSDGRLLGILAVPKPDGQTLAVRGSDILDLTDTMENGFVYFDLPEGAYRLFILFTTRTGGGRDHYMNLIDSSSVKVLLDEVYEKHYARYSKYFGNVIAGFFSDEPELGNVKDYPFDNMLGQKDIRLPWSDELERKLTETWKEEFLTNLPALWYDSEEKTTKVRTNIWMQ